MPLTEICNAVYSDPRQRQLFKNIVYVGRARCCWRSTRGDREAVRRAVPGKEKLLASNVQALHLGATSQGAPAVAAGRCACGAPTGGRAHLRRRQQRRGAGLRVRRRHGRGLVSDHAVVVGGRGLPEVLRQVPRRPGHGARTATPSCRPRTRSPPSAWWWAQGWNGARAFTADLGAGHLADDRVHRAGVLRRDPGHHHQRAARRPLHRHAHAHAAGRHAGLRLRLARRHQARAAVAGRPARVLRARRLRRSTWPTGCRRRCS
jgi:hypothetical protein